MSKKVTWYTKPKIILSIPKDKFVFFIDESGMSSKKTLENSLSSTRKGTSIRDDVYMLNGIILDGSEHLTLTQKFNRLKKKITDDGTYDYPRKGNRPINLHNVEIEGKKKPFHDLYGQFPDDLNRIILTTKFVQVSSGINYYIYGCNNENFLDNYMPMLLGNIITKYANFLNDHNREGIIIFETDNELTDLAKLSYVKKLLRKGSNKNSAIYFSKITAVYFRPKWTNVNGDWRTCAGLELADLTISSLRRLYHPEFITIENKMYGYPNYGRDSINIIK